MRKRTSVPFEANARFIVIEVENAVRRGGFPGPSGMKFWKFFTKSMQERFPGTTKPTTWSQRYTQAKYRISPEGQERYAIFQEVINEMKKAGVSVSDFALRLGETVSAVVRELHAKQRATVKVIAGLRQLLGDVPCLRGLPPTDPNYLPLEGTGRRTREGAKKVTAVAPKKRSRPRKVRKAPTPTKKTPKKRAEGYFDISSKPASGPPELQRLREFLTDVEKFLAGQSQATVVVSIRRLRAFVAKAKGDYQEACKLLLM